MRYAIEKRHMHACRNSFLLAIADPKWNLTKRDVAANINFFMNVPVTPEGKLTFEDGISEAGEVRRDAGRDGCDLRHQQLPAAE